jgi:hypothetical protein
MDFEQRRNVDEPGLRSVKIMTAGDIATGFVTVTAGGAFNGTLGHCDAHRHDGIERFDKMEHFDSPGSASGDCGGVTGMLGVSSH